MALRVIMNRCPYIMLWGQRTNRPIVRCISGTIQLPAFNTRTFTLLLYHMGKTDAAMAHYITHTRTPFNFSGNCFAACVNSHRSNCRVTSPRQLPMPRHADVATPPLVCVCVCVLFISPSHAHKTLQCTHTRTCAA